MVWVSYILIISFQQNTGVICRADAFIRLGSMRASTPATRVWVQYYNLLGKANNHKAHLLTIILYG